MKTLTQPIGAPVNHLAAFDGTDYQDEHEAEQHAKSYSLANPHSVTIVNVHPMAQSPYVAYLAGQETWRATTEEIAAMSKEGLRLLRAESGR